MEDGVKHIATNRKARFEYRVDETYEAGIALLGSEVKSLREGRVDFRDAYAAFEGDELFLIGLHIPEYVYANRFNHEPTRPRKLLLRRQELNRVMGRVREQGYTLVPMRLYFKRGKVKVEIGLAKGKRTYDKRESIKKRDTQRLRDQGDG